MSDDFLKKIIQALDKTRHPSINASFPQLGMVNGAKIEDNKVIVTFKLPFAGIPENIKNMMFSNIKEVLNPFGLDIQVKLAVMDEEEKQHFLIVEKENWKGAPPQ